MRKPVSKADAKASHQGSGRWGRLSPLSASLTVLALPSLPRGRWGTEVVRATPPGFSPHGPLLIPFPRTHCLLFLETHYLATDSTVITMGTSIPNRMATKLDASGVQGTETGMLDR